jgi:hypothetical protein
VGTFFGNWEFPAQKSTFLCSVFPQDAPLQMTQRALWLCSCVVGQETPEVSYPTDLSNGYQTGPEYRKNSKCTWNRQQMVQYGSSARCTCLGGALESCIWVYDYSGFHFCWSLRSKPSRSTDIPPPPRARSPTRSYSRCSRWTCALFVPYLVPGGQWMRAYDFLLHSMTHAARKNTETRPEDPKLWPLECLNNNKQGSVYAHV